MDSTRIASLCVLLAVGCGDDAPPPEDTSGTMEVDTSSSSTTVTPPATSSGMPTTVSSSSGSESSSSTGGYDDPPAVVDWPTLECDPLVDSVCGLPFPNNVFTTADDSTATGRRLAISELLMPLSRDGVRGDPAVFESHDGFSTSAAFLAHMPGATVTGLPGPWSIEVSLEDDSPTLIIDAETGERVPHFSEFDVSTNDTSRRALMVRPVVPLSPQTRYIVAIRNVVDAAGAPIPASPAFAALRDVSDSDEPSVDARRPLYTDIFERLTAQGVERGELQLAWDFTTASDENLTARMVEIRDDAFEVVGSTGPSYTIEQVDEDWMPEILRRIQGTMSVPLYLDVPEAGASMSLDDDGRPLQNGFAEYPFEILVPYSAEDAPAGVLNIGHGLLGSRTQVEAEYYRAFANDNNYILIATDWSGMANDDVANIITLVASGEIHRFHTVTDRLHQGVVNAALAVRMVAGGMVDDPLFDMGTHSGIDPATIHYIGSSQGGIFGSVLMAISPDIQRGVLDVPGQPYNLLLNRSVDFTPYLNVVIATYENPLEIQLLLGLIQTMWDRAEPAGYTHHIRDNPLPGTPSKDVLFQVAIGDHQVSSLGAHIMARAVGAPNVGPVVREIWGVPTTDGPVEGMGLIEYDFGLPPEPIENVPMTEGSDPHGLVRRLPASVQTRATFLESGMIELNCDGACDPE